MRALSLTVVALSSLSLLSCGAGVAPEPLWARHLPDSMPLSGELRARPAERQEPALELRLPFGNPGATSGWGAVHLWARPALDEVNVSAIVDAPARTARWAQCDEVRFDSPGHHTSLDARYIGTPMEGDASVYDAVQLRIGIDELRSMATDGSRQWTVCGDRFELSGPQRETLGRFVDWFDSIAAPRPFEEGPFFRDVGPDPELPGEDEVLGPLDA